MSLVNRSPAGPHREQIEPHDAGGNKSSLITPDTHFQTHTHTHTPAGLGARPAGDMKIYLGAVCVVISLLVHSYQSQKLTVNWGPQSMMYLKGKHGRRFVPDENSVLKLQDLQGLQGLHGLQGLQGWYAVLKGLQRLQSGDFRLPGHIRSLKKVLLQCLQER